MGRVNARTKNPAALVWFSTWTSTPVLAVSHIELVATIDWSKVLSNLLPITHTERTRDR